MHTFSSGVRYHSLKAQLDNLREITCEFQTECQHQWDSRTEEWSQDKKTNKKILDRIREQRPGKTILIKRKYQRGLPWPWMDVHAYTYGMTLRL